MRSIGIEQMQYKPDLDEVRNQKIRVERYRKYKIPTAFFSSSNEEVSIYTEDEKIAMRLIEQDREIPKEIEQKLLDTIKERTERNKKLNIE